MTTTAPLSRTPTQPRYYVAAALRVLRRPGASGDQQVLERASGWLEMSLDLLPVGDRARLEGQLAFATALLCRYELTKDEPLLDRARALLRQYGRDYPPGSDGRAVYLTTCAWASLRAAEASETVDAAREAVAVARRGVEEYPRDPAQLVYLGNALMHSFELTGLPSTISHAMRAHTSAVRSTPAGDPNSAHRLSSLGSALARKAAMTGALTDVLPAVRAHRDAVATADPADPSYATYLCNLGVALAKEYELGHAADILAEAIGVHRRALTLSNPEHVQHAQRVEGLANALVYRYEGFDDDDAVAESIELRRATLKNLVQHHPMRTLVQVNLAGSLLRRSERTEDTDGLDEAEHLMRQVLASTRPANPSAPTRMNLLGLALGRRGEAGAGPDTDLAEACDWLRKAIDTAPDGYGYLPMFRSNLAVFLTDFYESQRTVDPLSAEGALNEAVGLHRQAVSETPAAHSERGRRVANLAVVLSARAQHQQDSASLDEAAAVCEAALASLPRHDPGHALCLNISGQIDRYRFELMNDQDAGRRALESYARAAREATSPAPTRIRAARSAGILAAQLGEEPRALEELTSAIDLLERVVSPALRHSDQERLLAELTGLPRAAAAIAIAIGQPRDALSLLERGRGVLLGRMTDSRTQYDTLAELEPELAEHLREVQGRLDHLQSPSTAPTHEDALARTADSGSSADQRSNLARRYQELIAEIRSRPGFGSFLRPAPFEQLQQAAADGPVALVNISELRCDALVLSDEDLLHVHLPEVTSQEAEAQAEKFLRATDEGDSAACRQVVEWTWDRIAEPVLGALDITRRPPNGEPAPRLWWCPTGPAAFLPLHAAGRHDQTQDDGPYSVLDFTAPSYTSTLRSLIDLRRLAPTVENHEGARMLAVGVESTPIRTDVPPLVGVERDIAVLASRFTQLTVLTRDEATRDSALRAMAQHPYVHFACHGVANLNSPFEGYLQLFDGQLTARTIAEQHLPSAHLAFVSACETFRGGTGLPDEAISLATTLQLAGYRDVVATQWKVNELFTDTLASTFYDAAIIRNAEGTVTALHGAAHALRSAILAVRDSTDGAPVLWWAPFIHAGS